VIFHSTTFEIHLKEKETSTILALDLSTDHSCVGYALADNTIKMVNFWEKTTVGTFSGLYFNTVEVTFIKKMIFSDKNTIIVCSETEIHSYSSIGLLLNSIKADLSDDNLITSMSVGLID
jgi:hypothetical protein